MTPADRAEYIRRRILRGDVHLSAASLIADEVEREIREAVAAEREACAEVAEGVARAKREAGLSFPDDGLEIAEEIRARSAT